MRFFTFALNDLLDKYLTQDSTCGPPGLLKFEQSTIATWRSVLPTVGRCKAVYSTRKSLLRSLFVQLIVPCSVV